MDTRDPIEMLREGLKYERALDLLREQFGIELKPGWVHACLCRFADEIEAAYMKLPVDADGVPIRVGDEIEYPNGRRDVVRFITINDDLPTFNGDWWTASKCRHVKPDTVEGIIAEVYHLVREAEDERGLIADYAERIRKAVHDGD